MLKPEDIEEFRKIWKEDFNEELTFDQAKIEGERLIAFYRMIADRAKGFDSSSGSPERKIDPK